MLRSPLEHSSSKRPTGRGVPTGAGRAADDRCRDEVGAAAGSSREAAWWREWREQRRAAEEKTMLTVGLPIFLQGDASVLWASFDGLISLVEQNTGGRRCGVSSCCSSLLIFFSAAVAARALHHVDHGVLPGGLSAYFCSDFAWMMASNSAS